MSKAPSMASTIRNFDQPSSDDYQFPKWSPCNDPVTPPPSPTAAPKPIVNPPSGITTPEVRPVKPPPPKPRVPCNAPKTPPPSSVVKPPVPRPPNLCNVSMTPPPSSVKPPAPRPQNQCNVPVNPPPSSVKPPASKAPNPFEVGDEVTDEESEMESVETRRAETESLEEIDSGITDKEPEPTQKYLEASLEQQKKDNRFLVDHMDILSSKYEKLMQENAELRRTIKAGGLLRTSQEEALKDFQIRQLKSTVEDLKEELLVTRSANHNQELIMNELRAKLHQLPNTTQHVASLKQENSQLTNKLAESESKASNYEKQIRSYEQRDKNLKQRITSSSNTKRLDIKVAQQVITISKLQNNLKESEKQVVSLKFELKKVQSQNEAKENQIRSLENNCEFAESRRALADELLKQLEDKQSKEKAMMAKDLDETKEKLNFELKQDSWMQFQFNQMSAEMASAVEKLRFLEDWLKLKRGQHDISSSASSIDDLIQSLDQLIQGHVVSAEELERRHRELEQQVTKVAVKVQRSMRNHGYQPNFQPCAHPIDQLSLMTDSLVAQLQSRQPKCVTFSSALKELLGRFKIIRQQWQTFENTEEDDQRSLKLLIEIFREFQQQQHSISKRKKNAVVRPFYQSQTGLFIHLEAEIVSVKVTVDLFNQDLLDSLPSCTFRFKEFIECLASSFRDQSVMYPLVPARGFSNQSVLSQLVFPSPYLSRKGFWPFTKEYLQE